MRYRVIPYKQGSASARAISNALDGKLLRMQRSTFVPHSGDVIVNWGSQKDTGLKNSGAVVLNDPAMIARASNKLAFFKLLGENPDTLMLVPKYWTDKDAIEDSDFPVVCRTVLNGHSGEGIVIANNREELVNAPLYVKYVKKKDEYRVHVGRPDTIIGVQRKARRRGVPDAEVNWSVRNLANGFVYVRQNVAPPESVLTVAKRVFAETGLDFGAVDMVYNDRHDSAYALEVNTAPGLAGTTVDEYATYFKQREEANA